MSETHTPGLLHAGELDGGHVFLWDADEAHLVADVGTDDVAAAEAVANADRLAAAWNMVDGVPTSAIVHTSLSDTQVALNATDDLRRQRDELRRMLQRALDSLVCAVDAAGGDPVSHILCCEIRKALASYK